jgi:hypothetical protein
MRVLRDVLVNRSSGDELLAISHSAAITGEEMSLGLVGAGGSLDLRVRVLESRPVIIEGNVRHRLRLAVVSPADRVEPSEALRLLDVAANSGAEAI